jgi:SAM-dependent methyltransferase
MTLLYHELVPWYRLVDPPADHAEEAVAFVAALAEVVVPPPGRLLELGAGAGHNALHLKASYRCTLVDLSPEMSALSRELNPECEHVVADMRTVRLGELFDAVLIHDAIMYMTNEADLRAALATAFVHTRPGGGLIVAPDLVREDFAERATREEGAAGERALQLLMWDWDPDPGDDAYQTEFVLVMRDGDSVRTAHDPHTVGMFTRARWHALLAEVGYRVGQMARPLGDGTSDQIFLCVRPA